MIMIDHPININQISLITATKKMRGDSGMLQMKIKSKVEIIIIDKKHKVLIEVEISRILKKIKFKEIDLTNLLKVKNNLNKKR
jgi:hypothetical protein